MPRPSGLDGRGKTDAGHPAGGCVNVGSVVGVAVHAALAAGVVDVATPAAALLVALVVAAMPVRAVYELAFALYISGRVYDATVHVATAAEIAAGVLPAAVFGDAVAVVAVRCVAAAAAWAAPLLPSVPLRTMWSLAETVLGWDRVAKDRWELGCHGGLAGRLGIVV